MKRIAHRLLESIVHRYGYTLKDIDSPPHGLNQCVRILKANGFSPATVIDVGVGDGTPWLYDGFPTAKFELFEPLDIFIPSMEKICQKLNARYHVTALGACSGYSEIEVNCETPTSSTMSGFSRSHSPIVRAGKTATIKRQTVQVKRLDEFGPFEPPILLKLDVEGFEKDVLEGALDTLERTDVLISEISVTKRHNNDVSFGSYVNALETRGFSLIDIPVLTPLRRNGPLSFVDALFVRGGTALCP